MIKVNLHGRLGKDLGENWELDVSNVAEALRAIEANTKKLRQWLINYKDEYEYEILIDKDNLFLKEPKFENFEEVRNSEFFLDIKDKIQTIDIIPRIAGSGGVGQVLAGLLAILAAITLVLLTGGLASPFVLPALAVGIAGLGLVAAGVSNLLSKPPPSIPFTAQQINPIEGEGEAGGPTSYLFNGAVNTVGEGGPVPIGYGELVVGSNNVFSNYDIKYRVYRTNYNDTTLQLEYEGSNQYLFNNKGYLITQEPLNSLPF